MTGPVALICQRNTKLPFIFDAARRAGIDVVAIHDSSEPPPADNVPAVVESLALPVFSDPDAALDRLQSLAPEKGLKAVATLREEAVIWTARAADRLDLPSIPVATARATRDKGTMRTAFVAAGLASPGYARLEDPGDVSGATGLSPPYVVKPSGGWSSTGVTVAPTVDDLRPTVSRVAAIQNRDLGPYYETSGRHGKAAPPSAVIVEEYLGGPEFVVECFVDDAGVHVLAIGDKGQPTGPWFEETVYRVRTDIDAPSIRAIAAEAIAGVRALGITMGPAHAELRLDSKGRPHLLEIGARIGGSGVSHFIVEGATGIPFGQLCLGAALGQPTPHLPTIAPPRRVSANYIIPLGGHGAFGGIAGLDAVKRHPDTRAVIQFLEIGAICPAPPAFSGYPGFILSIHRNDADAQAYHRWLDETVRVKWR